MTHQYTKRLPIIYIAHMRSFQNAFRQAVCKRYMLALVSLVLTLIISGCSQKNNNQTDVDQAESQFHIVELAHEPTPEALVDTTHKTQSIALAAPMAPMADMAMNMRAAPLQSSIDVYKHHDLIYKQVNHSGDTFERFEQNPIKQTLKAPLSTFSSDVDTTAYSYVRRQLVQGYLPEKDAVRTEEMLNYFDYNYPKPASASSPFLASTLVHDSPWNENKKLIHIGIQGYEIEGTNPDSNLVFLLDVSGSMDAPDKLPLVKRSIELLLSQLKPSDTVAIVVYAGAAGQVLAPTKVKHKTKILAALNNLSAGGSTAGGEGLALAYQLAEENFNENKVNRIILATDGDFNVGLSHHEKLEDYVARKRENGVYLSVLGFGEGNYQDQIMQSLAQNGNGIAAYIDTLAEAHKVLIKEASSTLFPIANDLKIQIEFNPKKVSEYRLLGYETRDLLASEFNNDKVDAGDLGSGHSVTAIYEITLVGEGENSVDELRYAKPAPPEKTDISNELAYLKLRYKLPGLTKSVLIEQVITSDASAQADLLSQAKFAAAVAGFSQLLKGGTFTQNWDMHDALELAIQNRGDDIYGYRAELVQLMRLADSVQIARVK